MTPEKPERHGKLRRPGALLREFALLGLECNEFRELCREMSDAKPEIRLLVVDAQHLDQGFIPEAILYHRGQTIHATGESNEQLMRLFAGKADLTMINGNHYPGKSQVIFAQSKKQGSVQRRKDQVTDLHAIVRIDVEPDSFLAEIGLAAPGRAFTQKEQFLDWITSLAGTSPLKALLLAGGKSERMGTDKTVLTLHGKPQWQHLADILSHCGLEVYISCRESRKTEFEGYSVITDRVNDLGPYGGILSAFLHDPDSAWLVVAVDMPEVNEAMIRSLMDQRMSGFEATACRNEKGQPEPLFAIYEPSSFPHMLSGLYAGVSCPRKFLGSAQVNWISTGDSHRFTNLNTPEDLERWLSNRSSK